MIKSLQNQTIKQIKKIKKQTGPYSERFFIVEGSRFVSEIPNGYPVCMYIVSESYKESQGISHLKSDRIYSVTDSVFNSFSDTVTPQGILAVCEIKKRSLSSGAIAENGFYVIGDEISDPGNLGTIIRTADAAKASGVLLSKGCVSAYNTKALRAGMGSLFHIPVYEDIFLEEAIDLLKEKGYYLVASDLKGERCFYDMDFKNPCGLIVGNESRGISDLSRLLADYLVKIPMPGSTESLNAAVAAGILIYEAVRQRQYRS